MKGRLLVQVLVAAALVAVAGLSSAAEEAFRLGDVRGVVWADGLTAIEGQWGFYGAKELSDNLSKVVGHKVGFYTEKNAPQDGVCIFVGNTRAAREEGLDASSLRNGEWRLVTKKGRAFILAKTGMAACYGCTDFLERYAHYFYLTLDTSDPYRVMPDRIVPVADKVRSHAFYFRSLHCWGKRWPKTGAELGAHFSRRTAARSFTELEPAELPSRAPGTNHTFFDYVPPEKYAKEHPEYYSLGEDGKRHFARNNQSQLCFSNPDVFDIAYRSLVAFIEKDRAGKKPGEWPVIYDFSQMDNSDFLCLCDDCRKTIAKYDRKPGGHKDGGDAGLQLEFVNRLARKVRAKYPDVIIRTFAYVSTEEPPKGSLRPEPNVMIRMCDLYSKCDDQLPLEHPFNAHRRELIEQWLALSPHFELWDYHLGGTPLDTCVDAIAADIRLLHKLGVRRIYDETHFDGSVFFSLRYFVQAQLYREPQRNLETLVRVWCGIFGKGAGEMEAAIAFWRKKILENPPTSAANWHGRVLPYMTEANLQEFVRLMKAAYAKEAPGLCRARIARAIGEAEKKLLDLLRRTPGAQKRYAALRREYVAFAQEGYSQADIAEKERLRELKGVEENLEIAEMRFDDLPAEFGQCDPASVICLDWHHVSVHTGVSEMVDDPLSSRGKAAKCPVDARGNWARLNDEDLHTNLNYEFFPEEGGGYRWIRLGVGRIARNSYLGLPFWNPVKYRLPQYYIECDGLAVDPNWYEFWVSYRQQDGQMYFDRMVMKRVPPKK